MENKRISLSPTDIKKRMLLDLTNGNIRVISGGDGISVDMSYVPMGNIIPEVSLIEEDDQNIISVKNSEAVETNFVLTISKEIRDAEINLNNGDIYISGFSGKLECQVSNGGIKMENISGEIRTSTLSGELKITGLNGSLNSQATNGPLQITDWECSTGFIEARNSKVLIGLKTLTDNLDVKVRGGSLALGVSKSIPFTLIARGADVIDYFHDINGKSLGSPAKIENKEGGKKITLFSSTEKVKIAKLKELDKVIPDFEKLFKQFEDEIKENLDFDEFAKHVKSFGDEMQNFAKSFALGFKNMFDSKETKETEEKPKREDSTSQQPSERMEILNLLKAGTISADEAEKLLKALK